MSANPYDAVPYQSFAYAASHPARMATIATLFGLKPASSGSCRVLEIGCASGGNLLPMAVALPNSRFVGLDYSSVQIEAAKVAQQQLALTNIEFIAEDIRHADAKTLGEYDYIIAHGIYSWLPPDAQAAMLALYRDCLAPGGIGYISYNTLPGWRMRGIVRDMMLFHAELFGDEAKKVEQAKALLDFVASAIPAESNAYGQYLASELALIRTVNDSYLRHDHLEEHNEPLYFRDFMARTNAVGLHYLGESDFPTMVGAGIAPEAYRRLQSEITDIARLEQYMDFLRNRSFRQTLLTKSGSAIQRNIVSGRLSTLHVAAKLLPSSDVRSVADSAFVSYSNSKGDGLSTGTPITKAALSILAEAYPATVPFSELTTKARDLLPPTHRKNVSVDIDATNLANDILVAFMAPGLVHLQDTPQTAIAKAGEHPAGFAYARWQAKTINTLTNLRHETVLLDTAGQLMLTELDGTKDRSALATALHEHIVSGRLCVQSDGETMDPDAAFGMLDKILDAILDNLAQNALIEG